LLDTDTCVGVLRGHASVVGQIGRMRPGDCGVSVVSVYELFCGVEQARSPERERIKVQRFLAELAEVPLDRMACEKAATIRANLERQGLPIGPYDLLIAGQAVANGLTLVSGNAREFQRVAGLRLTNWF
jgi:tRNA(fMet)-specific endonuclease VapC